MKSSSRRWLPIRLALLLLGAVSTLHAAINFSVDGGLDYLEQTSPKILAVQLIAQSTTGSMTSATVSISGGFVAGDTLNFTDQNGISGSYNSGTGVLTLSGAASNSSYEAALQSITFSSASDNPTNFDAATSRTFSWTVNNGIESGSTTSSLTVSGINDAPVVVAGTTVSFTEQGSAAVLASSLTLSDADNTTQAAATVSISSGFFAGDALNFANQNGISGSYNSLTGVLTLTGSASNANYQTALRSITFSSASDNPTSFGAATSRTISWAVNDGTLDSSAATSAVNITAVNDAPVVTAGSTVGFTEQGSAVVLASTLTVSDADNTTLAAATVSISGGFFVGDTLNFTDQNGISGSYDSGTGVLTLTGSASTGNYQAALRSVTFSSASTDPTNSGANPSRTIAWTANDGALASSAASSTINVTALDDAPVVTAGATVGFTEQGSAVVLASGLTVSDADNTTLASATVSISSGFVAGDTLNFTNQNGISGSYDSSTGVLTLSGSASIANYQAALRSITFSSASDNPTNFGANSSRTISWTVNDGTLASSSVTSTINVTAVNDAPVVTASGGTTAYTEGNNVTTTLAVDTGVTVSDADNATLASGTVAITANFQTAEDVLAFTNNGSTMGNIAGSYNSGTGVLTLTSAGATATKAQWQAALRAVTYTNSSNTPNALTRTVAFKVNDGAVDSATSSQGVSVAAVNDTPIVTTTGGTTAYAQNLSGSASPVIIDGGLTLSDLDSATLASGTVATTANFQSGEDVLAFTNDGSTMGNIAGSYNGGTGVLTLTSASATATKAQWQAALRAVTYANSSTSAHTANRTISYTINDGTSASAPGTKTLSVSQQIAVAATVTVTNTTQTYNGQPRPVTVTTSPAGLTTAVTYNTDSAAPTDAGTYAVLARIIQSGYVGFTNTTLTIAKATQTITFTAPVIRLGTATALSATASSGLAVNFTVVSGPATVSGATLTASGNGQVVLRAAQGGNGNFQAATNLDTTITVQGAPMPTVTSPNNTITAGGSVTLTQSTSMPNSTTQWQHDGTNLVGGTGSSIILTNLQPSSAGLYSSTSTLAGGITSTSEPAIVGLSTDQKVIGAGSEMGSNIVHANGNTYDQVLLGGNGASITADKSQVTRISFIDLSNDIVQVEFSGAGTLSVVMGDASTPAPAANYNQPGVDYVRGHAGLVITGANETSNLNIFTVGKSTAVNQALFKDGATYDGVADVAYVAIQSTNGKFGGVRTGNVHFWGTTGFTGVYAPGVTFAGPVNIGNVEAFDSATPVLIFGSAGTVAITGGSLKQSNNQPVQVSGITALKFVDGSTSGGTTLKAQANQAVLLENGVNVTARIVVNPTP